MTARFDQDGPLPEGTVVVEAGAGTGKTHQLAGLVARYVAEDRCTLPQLLVVTFTRLATSELRDRVRRRLASEAEEAGRAGDDVRRGRLLRAATDVDAATITTIHAFAERALRLLGLAADRDPSAILQQDPSGVVAEVLDDMSARALSTRGGDDADLPDRAALDAVAAAVLANPHAEVVPGEEDPQDGAVRLRVAAARLIRERVPARLAAMGQLSYDGLVAALARSVAVEEAAEELRRRYRVALVDEFQDTDAVQWGIFRKVFHTHATLVLIGDPKQSIYAFRGADVAAYLDAVRVAGSRRVLDECWRSDGRLVDGLNAVFAGAAFGDDRIAYRELSCTPDHRSDRLRDDPPVPPVRVRVLARAAIDAGRGPTAPVGVVRPVVARDVAAEAVRLLQRGSVLAAEEGDRPLAPHDVAVLVRTRMEAGLVHAELRAAGVPAVVTGVGSVLATEAAVAWQRLLDALARPGVRGSAATVALGPFMGWSAAQLAAAGDEELEELHDRLVRWSAVLREHGVAALYRTAAVERQLGPRLLARAGGERLVADLEHVAELLHVVARAERLGPAALAAVLGRERAAASRGGSGGTEDDRSRRLESDAEAVQVLTVHRAKGLEFPVVLCPFLFQPPWQPEDAAAVFDRDGGRVVDVSGAQPAGWADERAAEDLRLTYVALTRARHRVVLWWAPAKEAAAAALTTRLEPPGDVERPRGESAADRMLAGVAALGAVSGGAVVGEEVVGPAPARTVPVTRAGATHRATPPTRPLAAARFERDLDRSWGRTSYTALRGQGREAGPAAVVRTEPEDPGTRDDESLEGEVGGGAGQVGWPEGALATPVPLDGLAGGSVIGTLVHRALEAVDFTAADVEADLAAAVAPQGRWVGAAAPDPAGTAAGLRRALETPLGPLVDDLRLADVRRADRRDELAFELPLAGGDRGSEPDPTAAPPSHAVGTAAIADLLAAHLAADDPLAGYPDRLRELDRPVRGYLSGSLDLVLRHGGRWVLADYKTNVLRRWVDGVGQPLTPWDYRPAALATAMIAGDYPLQALLYAVALHRFLRWRQPGYDPAEHLGGVLYLFVRGMTGADVPRVDGLPCGVFGWQPPPGLVAELSDLLATGTAS